MDVPETMQAVRLMQSDPEAPTLDVRTVQVPSPGPGQVLIKVHAAPLHPGDRLFCMGQHGFRRSTPTTPGLEGCGTVVDARGGLFSRGLIGRRVAFLSDPDGDGSWAPYVAVQAQRCLPVWPALTDEQAALLLLGPCTALGLLDEVAGGRRAGIVVTAASGVMGRLLLRLAQRDKRPFVGLVHGPERVRTVRALGAAHVIDMEGLDAEAKLRRAVRAVQARCVLDVVGGRDAGLALAALPDGGELIHHGTLSGEAPQVDPDDLVYRGKHVRGYWVEDRLRSDGLRARIAWLPRLRALAPDVAIAVRDEIGLDDVPALIREPTRGLGRHLIRPDRTR